MTCATQYLVPGMLRFREWKICRCFGGTVVYVHKIGTEMNLCAKIVTGGNAYMWRAVEVFVEGFYMWRTCAEESEDAVAATAPINIDITPVVPPTEPPTREAPESPQPEADP